MIPLRFQAIWVPLILFIAAIAASCVHGNPQKEQTVTEKLNGENYKSGDLIMGVPVLERKNVRRRFSGKVYCGTGLSRMLVNHAAVELKEHDRTVAATATGFEGSFELPYELEPGQQYSLNFKASCGNLTKTLLEDLKKISYEAEYDLKP